MVNAQNIDTWTRRIPKHLLPTSIPIVLASPIVDGVILWYVYVKDYIFLTSSNELGSGLIGNAIVFQFETILVLTLYCIEPFPAPKNYDI